MKKFIFRISVIVLILILSLTLFSGCTTGTNINDKGNVPSAVSISRPLEQALLLPDDQLVEKYTTEVDIALGDDLLFSDSKDIPSQTLLTFFCYITSNKGNPKNNEYAENYQQKWYNPKDNQFHIPVAEVTGIVNKYFDGINFDPKKISGYDSKTNEIIKVILSGFGGVRFPRLVGKEILSNNTLKLTVDFYDPEYKTILYTKIYTFRFNDNGYQYLSITKK